MSEQKILSIRQVQKIELDIMILLHEYLVRKKLRYCMAYGTLLGAIRHKGFIPWDNDMDILMPRPDFEKLLKYVREENIAPNIKLIHYTTDSQYHYQCIRIFDERTEVVPTILREIPKMGVWVDIFPVDGVPIKPTFSSFKLQFWKQIQRVDLYKKNGKKPLKFFLKIIIGAFFPNSEHKHEKLIDQYAKKYPFETSEFVADTVERNPRLVCLSHHDFEEPTETEFEGHLFFAPQDSDAYLKVAYGDYMQLPPEHLRMTHQINAVMVRKGKGMQCEDD